MQRPAKPCTPVRFRPQPPSSRANPCPGGEIGRRKGLKIGLAQPFVSSVTTQAATQVTTQVTTQAATQAIYQIDKVAVVLAFCQIPRSRQEIMQELKLKSAKHVRESILKPLLEDGKLALTKPDKPNSPNQKYRTID